MARHRKPATPSILSRIRYRFSLQRHIDRDYAAAMVGINALIAAEERSKV